MTTEWDEIKSAFSDGTNTGFQTDVVLRARKFNGEKIYECGFLPDDMVESLRTALLATGITNESDVVHGLDKAVTVIHGSRPTM